MTWIFILAFPICTALVLLEIQTTCSLCSLSLVFSSISASKGILLEICLRSAIGVLFRIHLQNALRGYSLAVKSAIFCLGQGLPKISRLVVLDMGTGLPVGLIVWPWVPMRHFTTISLFFLQIHKDSLLALHLRRHMRDCPVANMTDSTPSHREPPAHLVNTAQK